MAMEDTSKAHLSSTLPGPFLYQSVCFCEENPVMSELVALFNSTLERLQVVKGSDIGGSKDTIATVGSQPGVSLPPISGP